VFNLIFKSGDLGSEPVSKVFQVTNCSGEYIDFDLSCDLTKSSFKLARAWVLEPGASGMTPRARSWSLILQGKLWSIQSVLGYDELRRHRGGKILPSFKLGFLGTFGFELLKPCSQSWDVLVRFLEFIFIHLSLLHLLERHPQELVFVMGMFYHRLFQGWVRPQDKKVTGNMETYVYKLGGILHAGIEDLDSFLFSLGIHGHRHVSTDVEPYLNEVRVVP
jgi:hypothetical protein